MYQTFCVCSDEKFDIEINVEYPFTSGLQYIELKCAIPETSIWQQARDNQLAQCSAIKKSWFKDNPDMNVVIRARSKHDSAKDWIWKTTVPSLLSPTLDNLLIVLHLSDSGVPYGTSIRNLESLPNTLKLSNLSFANMENRVLLHFPKRANIKEKILPNVIDDKVTTPATTSKATNYILIGVLAYFISSVISQAVGFQPSREHQE